MAIKFKELEQAASSYKAVKYIYKDLALDIQQDTLIVPEFKSGVLGTDIKASYNLAAIINSLQNLFNTLPGQRFLFPEYGLDLYQFLFEPITELNARALGERIYYYIELYEPRVTPVQVNVATDPDRSQYNIDITIEVPSLALITTTNFLFNTKKQSFILLPTSRNA